MGCPRPFLKMLLQSLNSHKIRHAARSGRSNAAASPRAWKTPRSIVPGPVAPTRKQPPTRCYNSTYALYKITSSSSDPTTSRRRNPLHREPDPHPGSNPPQQPLPLPAGPLPTATLPHPTIARAVEAPPAPATTSTGPAPQASPSPAPSTPFPWTDHWYPVAAVADLDPKRPQAMHLLGIPLVLWRDGAGEWRAMEDKCPHRYRNRAAAPARQAPRR